MGESILAGGAIPSGIKFETKTINVSGTGTQTYQCGFVPDVVFADLEGTTMRADYIVGCRMLIPQTASEYALFYGSSSPGNKITCTISNAGLFSVVCKEYRSTEDIPIKALFLKF